MKKKYLPARQLMDTAIIKAINNLGGIASVPEINKEVISILNIPDDIVQMEDESGLDTLLNYRLRWCRTNLKNKGLIKNIKKGTWAIVNKETGE